MQMALFDLLKEEKRTRKFVQLYKVRMTHGALVYGKNGMLDFTANAYNSRSDERAYVENLLEHLLQGQCDIAEVSMEGRRLHIGFPKVKGEEVFVFLTYSL